MRICLPLLALVAIAGCRSDPSEGDRRPAPRDAPAGTIPFGYTTSREPGLVADPEGLLVDAALLARGQDRYAIFCTPCHGTTGEGDGPMTRAGLGPLESLHLPRVQALDASALFRAIGDRRGASGKAAHAHTLPPRDRWALVAYLRALQRAGPKGDRVPIEQAMQGVASDAKL